MNTNLRQTYLQLVLQKAYEYAKNPKLKNILISALTKPNHKQLQTTFLTWVFFARALTRVVQRVHGARLWKCRLFSRMGIDPNHFSMKKNGLISCERLFGFLVAQMIGCFATFLFSQMF